MAAVGGERRDSIGALDDNDRELLNRVLNTAKQAIDESRADRESMRAAVENEARERATLEGKVLARFSEYDAQIKNMGEDVAELKGLRGDIGGLRGDISSLTSAVTRNLEEDSRRDRSHGELVLRVEQIANQSGKEAGAASGKRSGGWAGLLGGSVGGPLVIGFVIWLISSIVAIARGQDLPTFPQLGAPAHPAPSSSAH